jgi:hypothetical protein
LHGKSDYGPIVVVDFDVGHPRNVVGIALENEG